MVVSNVTTMNNLFHNLFHNAFSFNQPLNNWDVTNVTEISFMCHGSVYNFKHLLGSWNLIDV